MTICAGCWHFIRLGAVWYDQLCGHPAVQRPREIDPVTGDEDYRLQNLMGQTGPCGRPQPFAREVNHGDCPYFEAK